MAWKVEERRSAAVVHGNDVPAEAVVSGERRRENGNMQFVLRQVGAAPRVALQAQRSMHPPPPSCLAVVDVHVGSAS